LIDDRAIIEPGASLAADVSVGPWSVIGADVEIGEGTWIGPHVVIRGPTRIGRRNRIYQFCSIGDIPQDKKYGAEKTLLEIGDDNVVREFCTFNRGTEQGGGVTRIGDRNWIMATVHIAHDCIVGSDVTFANLVTLGGHVTVADRAILGGGTLVHQFCSIGSLSFSAAGTVILKDLPPYVMVSGNPASAHGLNKEGLRRAGMDQQVVDTLQGAYKTVYRSGLRTEQAIKELAQSRQECEQLGPFISFLQNSSRGIIR